MPSFKTCCLSCGFPFNQGAFAIWSLSLNLFPPQLSLLLSPTLVQLWNFLIRPNGRFGCWMVGGEKELRIRLEFVGWVSKDIVFHSVRKGRNMDGRLAFELIGRERMSPFWKYWILVDLRYLSVQFSSVAQLCPTLCNTMNCSTPGLPVHHQLPELTQTHVHWVSDAIQPSHPLSSPSPLVLNLSQHQGLFQWVSSSHQVAKVLEFQLQHQSLQWTFRTDFL